MATSEVTDVKKESDPPPLKSEEEDGSEEKYVVDDVDSFESVEKNGSGSAVVKSKPTKSGAGAAVDLQYFFEDIVFRIVNKGRFKFGMVIETCETYDDDEFDDLVERGEVRVAWYPDGEEDVYLERDIGLVDRTLMPGDVVRRLFPGKNSQRGYCRDLNLRADLRIIGTKHVMTNVPTHRLRTTTYWQRDTAVCLDSWIGSTKEIDETAILRAKNGARIEVTSKLFWVFEDGRYYNSRGVFDPVVMYPGSIVIGRLPSFDSFKLLTPDIPLAQSKKGKPIATKFEVESVTLMAIWVHWHCRAITESQDLQTAYMQQPNACVKGDDLNRLKRLTLFEACMLQIGDRNFITYSKDDRIVKKSTWDKEQAAKYKEIFKDQQKDEYQNLFINADSSSMNSNCETISNGTSATAPHSTNERARKRTGLLEGEKSGKSKKFPLKSGDKLLKERTPGYQAASNSNLKEKSSSLDKSAASHKDDDGWESDEEAGKGFFDNLVHEDAASTTTTMSTCSSSSARSSPKRVNRRIPRRKISKKQLNRALPKKPAPEFNPQEGDNLITETLMIYSTVTVVWQDGSIEYDVPSTELYPIHHLDNHEFFPGDLVISGIENGSFSCRDYGIVQNVDHLGRTARVKWFTTYATTDEPKPTFKGETEMSVYDLKDHPDFQYRPGTMVIRVANFYDQEAQYTAGQIIDNFPDGRIHVWWVDGHRSFCWPQDLFEVGQYDQVDWAQDSEDSWETESENSELGDVSGTDKSPAEESNILAHIERARVSISRLEVSFEKNKSVESSEVMRKLVSVYKHCRHLDRLLGTTYFHEENFVGVMTRSRRTSFQAINDRAIDRRSRLFNESTPPQTPKEESNVSASKVEGVKAKIIQTPSLPTVGPISHQILNPCQFQAIVSVNVKHMGAAGQNGGTPPAPNNYAPKVVFNLSTLSLKTPCVGSAQSSTTVATDKDGDVQMKEALPVTESATNAKSKIQQLQKIPVEEIECEKLNESDDSVKEASSETDVVSARSSETSVNDVFVEERNQLLAVAILNLERALEKINQLRSTNVTIVSSQNDSGIYTQGENLDAAGSPMSTSIEQLGSDLNAQIKKGNRNLSLSSFNFELTDTSPLNGSTTTVGSRLCAVLKEQLLKCINEIREKYHKSEKLTLNDVFGELPGEEPVEAAVDVADGLDEFNNEEINEALPFRGCGHEEAGAAVKLNSEAGGTVKSKEESSGKVNDGADVAAVGGGSGAVSAGDVSQNASEVEQCNNTHGEHFQMLSRAPKSHKFYTSVFHPKNPQLYYRAVQREHRVLRNSLPPGAWVRIFEDRLDLLSVMIEGPKKTPYEDGRFFFDMQLGHEYPKSPPLCHYISYCSDRLNPNLYEDGKVCVSLLGTWSGRDTEVWGPNSTVLQVIVSIQGLILVPEPYFNEAGYEKQRGSPQGTENSRMYNEMVIIKMVQATTKVIQQPPIVFRDDVTEFYRRQGMNMYKRIKGYIDLCNAANNNKDENGMESASTEQKSTAETEAMEVENAEASSVEVTPLTADCITPEFVLLPASRGFCLTLEGQLMNFKAVLLRKFFEKKENFKQESPPPQITEEQQTMAPPGAMAVKEKGCPADEGGTTTEKINCEG